jgi:hypothetical protein
MFYPAQIPPHRDWHEVHTTNLGPARTAARATAARRAACEFF